MLPRARDVSHFEVKQRFIPVKDPDPVKRLGRLLVPPARVAPKVPVRRIPADEIRKHIPR
jgi:hypothetical protein